MSYRMLVLAKKIVSEMKDFYQVNEPIKVEKSDIETIEWLIEQAEKYREALEEITKVDLSDGKSSEHYQTEAVYMKITALKALEESKW